MSGAQAPGRANRAETLLTDLTELFAQAIRNPGHPAVLQYTLDAALRAVRGNRAFVAMMDRNTGDLVISNTAGPGWDDESRRLRLSLTQEDRRGITGHVALTGQPYVSDDVRSDPHYVKFFRDTRSEMAVPIGSSQGQTRGVINIDSRRLDAFDTADCANVVALAQAATASLVMDGFRSRERALIQIARDLTAPIPEDGLMNLVVDTAADALEYEECSVFLLDEDGRHLVLGASRGGLAARVGLATYALGEGLTGWVAAHAEPVRLEEPGKDPRWRGRHTEVPEGDLGAMLAVPITSADKVLGVLRVLRRRSRRPWLRVGFTEADERVLGTIARQLGVALENARAWQRVVRAERMAAWGELSARSAHMIGNRTFALKGDLNELGYLLEALPPGDQKCELELLAASMARGITALDEILRDFRDFVMATHLEPRECSIEEVLRECVEETFPKRSVVSLRLELASGLPVVRCDAPRLKRAVGELIENAVSFMPDGGTLTVGARSLREDEHQNWGVPFGPFVVISVADTGPGVPSDVKPRIFQPFFTSRVKGMGLGLPIVKGVIEAHRGRIRETGEPGTGATFEMLLPAVPSQGAAARAERGGEP